MKARKLLLFLVVWFGLLAPIGSIRAQEVTNAVYTLLDGSTLIDDCLICGRPTIERPLRGTFQLVLQDSNPLFTRYRMTNIDFHAGAETDSYTITGTGTFQIGGEVAIQQDMTLDVKVNDRPLFFTNGNRVVEHRFPLISCSLAQTQFNLLQFFSIKLFAAPVREIWFSTVSGFTSAFNSVHGSGGDVLSASGRIVKSVSNLVAQLGLMPANFPPTIDALDIGPGSEIFFSFDQNQTSSTLDSIQHGDLVSNRGRIVQRNQELTSAFGIMPAVPDVGLDAVMVKDDGEILFSIKTDIFGERLGGMLRHGDVLSSKGQIAARNSQLLSRFHPGTVKDYGLDALYVWPSGEIWFSTEEGFQDQQLGPVLAGDLLSSEGLIVFRNLELMSAFAPLEDLADFGLDALFIVTDVTAFAPPPHFTQISRLQGSQTISLRWEGQGRVFQVEKAGTVTGPYLQFSPLLPDLMFEDVGAIGAADQSFYRLRQW